MKKVVGIFFILLVLSLPAFEQQDSSEPERPTIHRPSPASSPAEEEFSFGQALRALPSSLAVVQEQQKNISARMDQLSTDLNRNLDRLIVLQNVLVGLMVSTFGAGIGGGFYFLKQVFELKGSLKDLRYSFKEYQRTIADQMAGTQREIEDLKQIILERLPRQS